MKNIMLMSVHDACEYVLEHFYPFGLREFGLRQDTYAVISIQDSHCGGFGLEFVENEFCKGVLTLHFDDIVKEVEGAVLFDSSHAMRIINFINDYGSKVDTLLVHCYAGQSRSRAVAAFAAELMGESGEAYFGTGSPNMHVYGVLKAAINGQLIF